MPYIILIVTIIFSSTSFSAQLYTKNNASNEGFKMDITYSQRQKLPATNNLTLIYSEETEVAGAGIYELSNKGKLVFGVRAPLNVRNLQLKLDAVGAIKIDLMELGSYETMQTESAILWDKQYAPSAKKMRTINLDDTLNRWQKRKGLQFTHCTASHILFFTITTGHDNKATISNIYLEGSVLNDVAEFSPQVSYSSKVSQSTSDSEFSLVSVFNNVLKQTEWEASFKLKIGTTNVLNNIPFVVSPITLNQKLNSFAILINHKAGALNFAHYADSPEDNKDWVATYLIVYKDGSTIPVFCNLGWNCGTYDGSMWQKRGPIRTWWGPPAFPYAGIYRIPKSKNMAWKAIYTTSYINPYPDKIIDKIIVCKPDNKSKFTLVGLTLTEPRQTELGLITTDRPTFRQGSDVTCSIYLWKPNKNNYSEKRKIQINKPHKLISLKSVNITNKDSFGFASANIELPNDDILPGPVFLSLTSDDNICHAKSSLLGLMPKEKPSNNFYWTMIAGGHESIMELERIKRLGYDAIKIHMQWNDINPEKDLYDFSKWEKQFSKISKAGLNIAVRNQCYSRFIPAWLNSKVAHTVRSDSGQTTGNVDYFDPLYKTSIVEHYARVAEFVKDYPAVISINANYGLGGCGTYGGCGSKGVLFYGDKYELPHFLKYMKTQYILKQIKKECSLDIDSWNDITAEIIVADHSGLLMDEFIKHHQRRVSDIQKYIVEAIRNAGFNGHLTFNTAYHTQWQQLNSRPMDTYLRLGQEYGPAAPFNETSERYCLSFYQWLSTKRTFNLPYGDEAGQCPPTYEHAIRAYQWMLMMQCWDANYCQWYSGRPASQNIAWLKPFYEMIYNSQYIADPISLTFSLDSSSAEALAAMNVSDAHKPAMSHYGLVNFLRYANLNSDKYIFDSFPETYNTKAKVVFDDITRSISDTFAQIILEYINSGGIFVISSESDILQNHKFEKSLGVLFNPISNNTKLKFDDDYVIVPGRKWSIEGEQLIPLAFWETNNETNNSDNIAVAVKNIGKGYLLILGTSWDQKNYDTVASNKYADFLLSQIVRLGNFSPNIICDVPNINVTPYRENDNSILLYVINKTAKDEQVRIGVNSSLLGQKKVTVHDLGLGITTSIPINGDKYQYISTFVPAYHSNIIRIENK